MSKQTKKSSVASKILAIQREREKQKREEEEKIRLEEEQEQIRLETLKKLEEERKIQKKIKKEQKMNNSLIKKKEDVEKKRLEILKRFNGTISGKGGDPGKKMVKKVKVVPEPIPSETIPKYIPDVVETWEDLEMALDEKTQDQTSSIQNVDADKVDMIKIETNKLRSPICCVLGHVDTGKTKLLDKMRNSKVQEGEAGGITQQIGATYFPIENIKEVTQKLNQRYRLSYTVPGLLVIDTPGHESFSNLRSRGSSLCDIAILVVDIMHGLEPQTIESINLLKSKQTPFVVALNKIDRLYGWKTIKNSSIQDSLKIQGSNVLNEYENRVKQIVGQFQEQGLNAELYYKAKKLKDFQKNVSLVPCSALSGEGITDLLLLLVQLTQRLLGEDLKNKEDLECTVLEARAIEGLGTTIDVILSNGVIEEGDEILLCGMNGPIRTTIRSLLTPPPLKELRVKNQYIQNKKVYASTGVKIVAKNLEEAIAGSLLFVIKGDTDIEKLENRVMEQIKDMGKKVEKYGVYVQASTLGSLEALMDFLSKSKIPVSGFGIGSVHKKDVLTASVMSERFPEYSVILAFDVYIAKDIREYAEKSNVRIFDADIIYHLETMFKKYLEEINNKKKIKAKADAIFPCILEILPEHVFNKKNPIVLGVKVKDGILKIGTPLCVLKNNSGDNVINIGKISSIQKDHNSLEEANIGEEVSVSIIQEEGMPTLTYGRQFDHQDLLISKITRNSLDALKSHYTQVCKDHFGLLKKLKKQFL